MMKIWKSFGSAHSANITIIGEFEEGEELVVAEKLIKDLEFADSRYKDVLEFINAWKAACPSIMYSCLSQDDFETGINDSYDVQREGGKITVSGFSTRNIGGIVKLMLVHQPKEIKILEPPKQ